MFVPIITISMLGLMLNAGFNALRARAAGGISGRELRNAMLATGSRVNGSTPSCEIFAKCAVKPGDTAAILSETQSRALNVQLAELALLRLGARPFHLVVPTPRNPHPVPVPLDRGERSARRTCARRQRRSARPASSSTARSRA